MGLELNEEVGIGNVGAAAPGGSASERVARNGVLYFLSLAIPALAALWFVPVTVHGLGPARFGLLALAWAVAEGTGMFDFGLGRATVRFVADATAREAKRIEQIILASVFTQTSAGIVAGVLLFFLAPTLVRHVFSISPAGFVEATAMFRVLAFHIPVLLCSAALRAALEGAQRFDLGTALKVPASVASVVIPAVVAWSGGSLVTIMWLLLAVRLALMLITAEVVRRSLLRTRWRPPGNFVVIREMLGYSGWVALSTALSPPLASLDRFMVGSIVGVTALGYYTGAAEAANRFLLIPATAFAAILPALAHADASGGRARTLGVTRAAKRQLAALFFPLALMLFVFGPAILGLWLGPAFAVAAGPAFRILSIGVFLGGLAHLPLALLYGSGRPDIPAKIHMGELVVHVPLTYVLVRGWGISGAAIAWSLRCAADFVLYEIFSRQAIGRPEWNAAESKRFRSFVFSAAMLAVICGLSLALRWGSVGAAASLVVIALACYSWVGWIRVLSPEERGAWLSTVLRIRQRMMRR